jgi:hypothetical protein
MKNLGHPKIVKYFHILLIFRNIVRVSRKSAENRSVFLIAMKWGFITFALISVVGIYFSFIRGNVERK